MGRVGIDVFTLYAFGHISSTVVLFAVLGRLVFSYTYVTIISTFTRGSGPC